MDLVTAFVPASVLQGHRSCPFEELEENWA